MNNELLYGNDPTEKIVSIEVKDSIANIFLNDGTKLQQETTNWILCNEQIDSSWKRLKGDLHYKYIKYIETDKEFYSIKKSYKHRDLFFINNPKERFMVTEGLTYFKGLAPQDISILSFDIETTGLKLDSNAKILIIANTFRKNGVLTRKLFCYDEYKNQGELLKAWCKWILEIDPDILVAHNGNLFDLPYINFIAQNEKVKLKLGRDESSLKFDPWESKFRKDGSQFYHYFKPKIYGREIIDTLFLSIKYDIVEKKYENYRLKNIIKQENLEKPGRTFYDASLIQKNYLIPEEWEKIKSYAMDDGDDALALYDLMSPPFFYSAQMIPKSYQLITESAEGSKINSMMIRSYFQNSHSLPKASEVIKYEGAISDGFPGIYKNVFKIDIASLYPSIMIQYEVYDKDKDPNGNFLQLVKTLTEQRLTNKKLAKETGNRYYKDLSESQKILINSSYGFLGSTGLCFNNSLKAAFITATGREIIETAMEWAKNKGFKLVNVDTDSISFCKGDESFISKEQRQDLLNEINGLFPEKIRFEDDGFYKTLVVIKIKNYIMELESGQIKYKGSAIKSTNKEPALKQFIKDIIESIFNNKRNFLEIYNNYAKEIMNLKDITRWSSKKTITEKVLNGTRANETKVKDSISGTDYAEGDKIYTFFDEDCNIKLVEHFNGSYNKDKLLEKLYKTSEVFSTIIPEGTFLNYKLKKNKKLLELL